MTATGARDDGGKGRLLTAGTLTYTRGGLIALFGWLLWGDFVFQLMESVIPNLLPLILKEHGASNKAISIIVGTIAMVANAVINPVISYRSDRCRSRWGRRRPYIIFSTPFVVLFLAAIPFGPEILALLEKLPGVSTLLASSPVTPILLMFGFLVVGFQIFNMFISAVYYYLIPDVVPGEYLGRFYGLFRLVGVGAGAVFNYFILGHAETWMREIFVGIALVYGVCILLMCWRVKEGEYPPPADESHGHWWSGIRNYFKECYGYSYYWWVFLAYSCLGWAGLVGMFRVFFAREEIGLTLEELGQTIAAGSVLVALLAYPFGILLDRWGSHRTLITAFLVSVPLALLMFFFTSSKWSFVAWTILREVPWALAALALAKWTVDVYPRTRYGQFGSAGALFSSLGAMALGPLGGLFIDWTGSYRYLLLWQAGFLTVGIIAALVVHRRWQALGGESSYRAP